MKYLFFDIDGTLACGTPGRQYIPESTKLALQKLRDAGHFTAIATGRAHAMAVNYMHQLGFENMVSDGGYGVTINDQLLSITPLDYEPACQLVDECKAKNFIWALQTEDSVIRYAPDNRFYEFTHDVYMKTKFGDGLDPRNYKNIYKVYVACYAPHEEELETLKKLPHCRFHKEYLFVEPADKAYGIRKIVDHFGGSYKDVIVFGDGLNDLSMFIDDWTCVAMGNAAETLKEKADYITDDVDKDGILNACRHFHLF